MVFKVYEWTPYIVDLETCYRFEEKDSKVDKGDNEGGLTSVRVLLMLDVP